MRISSGPSAHSGSIILENPLDFKQHQNIHKNRLLSLSTKEKIDYQPIVYHHFSSSHPGSRTGNDIIILHFQPVKLKYQIDNLVEGGIAQRT